MLRSHITDICILHYSVLTELMLFWRLFLFWFKRSLIVFPCLKQRVDFWIVLNGNIYGVFLFRKSDFHKINTEEKLEHAFKEKKFLLLYMYG